MKGKEFSYHSRILVLADDFSGACEIGGVGWRFGLEVIILFHEDLENSCLESLWSEYQLIIIDTETRNMDFMEAAKRVGSIFSRLKFVCQDAKLFKKIDSALRGPILSEIFEIMELGTHSRGLIVPGNPSKNRVVFNGELLVNSKPLHLTSIGLDSFWPRQTSSVEELLGDRKMNPMPYAHFRTKEEIPKMGVFSFDVTSRAEIVRLMEDTDIEDFYCGSSDVFEVYLEKLGFILCRKEEPKISFEPPFLLINGSKIVDKDELRLMDRFDCIDFMVPVTFNKAVEMANRIYHEIKNGFGIYLHVNGIEKGNRILGLRIEKFYKKFSKAIFKRIGNKRLNIFVTGGATAESVLQSMEVGGFTIIGEHSPGVVTLKPFSREHITITVKPGSYAWN